MSSFCLGCYCKQFLQPFRVLMIIVTISVMRTICYSSVRSKRTDNISLIEPRSFFCAHTHFESGTRSLRAELVQKFCKTFIISINLTFEKFIATIHICGAICFRWGCWGWSLTTPIESIRPLFLKKSSVGSFTSHKNTVKDIKINRTEKELWHKTRFFYATICWGWPEELIFLGLSCVQ